MDIIGGLVYKMVDIVGFSWWKWRNWFLINLRLLLKFGSNNKRKKGLLMGFLWIGINLKVLF